MGNDRHKSKFSTQFRALKEDHVFHIVPDSFPIPEDGIIGLPFLQKYKYKITNDYLFLGETRIPLRSDIKLQPGESTIKETFIDHQRTQVCFINTGERPIESNQIELDESSKLDRMQLLMQNLRTKHIDPSYRDSVEKIILSYADAFALEIDPLPCTQLTSHKIELKTEKPINIKSYKPPECHREEIKRQISEMLDKDIITHSDSSYNAPVWVVPKKTDASGKRKWRIVIDFRKLNELTDQDAYPIPDVESILSHLGNSKFFSALDLSSGFHQIPMDNDSKKYTAFSTPEGHFHYNRMPFGLKNAPATFQRMMDRALNGLIGKHCFVYLDDVIVFGRTIQEHNKNLATVLHRLSELRLKLQPDKCEFLKPELEYLGHVISKDGVKPNPNKIKSVKEFRQPRNPTEIKQFLGLAGYYRKFIRNFAKVAKPLTDLTKKDIPFHWTDKQQISFDTLKLKLCEEPILKYPDFSKEFTLTTDASNEGLGAILSQDGHPCCYVSRTLNPAEKHYTTTEKELLAIVWSIQRLRQYLLGRKFKIRTDHQALKWLHNVKDTSSRLIRWRLKLEEYDYDIEYHKGKDNTAADALSRVHITLGEMTGDQLADLANEIMETNQENKPADSIENNANDSDTDTAASNDLTDLDDILKYDNYLLYQGTPDNFKETPNRKQYFQLNTVPNRDREALQALKIILGKQQKIGATQQHFNIREIEMIRKIIRFIASQNPKKLYVLATEPVIEITPERKIEILKENHNGNFAQHFGENKTIARIKSKYFWENIEKDVKEFIGKCLYCQQEKLNRLRHREEACIPNTPEFPNDKIAMDIFGPLPITSKGNQFVLSIQDQLTKYLILIPMKDQRAESIIDKLIEHFIYTFSAPKQILTDQGSNFVSNLMQGFEEAFQIKHIKTTSFHPQSNGSLERTHATVKDLIRTCIKERQEEWDEVLKLICFGYNTAVHEGTGHTPFELTFGRKANLPSAISATSTLTHNQLFKLWSKKHAEYLESAKKTIEKK